MRICHVAPELLPVPPTKGGAIERWVRDAAVRLTRRGHEVHVVSRDADGEPGEREIDGVRYHHVRIPKALDSGLFAAACRGAFYYSRVGKVLARLRPEVVHHHSRPSGLWFSLSPGLAARQVISLHSMDYGWGMGYRGWDRRYFTRGFAQASRVLAVSKFIERHTVDRYPAVASKIETIYNGVDGDMFTAGAGSREPGLILYVGRVEARKGVRVLVDAFEQVVAARVPDARLRIVGPHSYWDAQPSGYYQQIVERAAANPRIELCEPTYDDRALAAEYRAATISVVPSTFPEALGLTSIEAQASGTPVVVSNAGGLPETVNAESGIVVEHGDVAALGEALVGLLQAPDRRRAMAEAARRWAMATFSWDVIAGELERVYGEALAAPATEAA